MKIGIVSLGLIGGSIFKALCETDNELFAVTRNKQTIEQASKYTQNVSDNYEILKNCDIVFVASPINKTLEILDKLENVVKSDCIVLDCASVKEFVMKKRRPYKFIGSHPMAGSENCGFISASKDLFIGAKWVLTPCYNVDSVSERVTESDLEKVKKIISLCGATALITNAVEHDYAVALISHMPLLISQAIFKTAQQNNLALQLASSGFRDMTRLALSNLEMALDMYSFNGENILKSIKNFNENLNFLKNTKDFKIYADIKNTRSKMYSIEGKNIF